jgi:dihydroorotate dehydrogenase electron transfer subunit
LKEFPIQEMLCPVVSNIPVNGEYFHLVLDVPSAALAGLPGQFFHLKCPSSQAGTPFLRRPMSVYRINRHERQIEFLYKNHGLGTAGLATLKSGDVLDVFGPLGQGFVSDGSKHVLMVARGVGLATMAPLAEQAIGNGSQVTAILSARSPDLVMSADYLESVGASIISVTDTDGTSDIGSVAGILEACHAANPFDYAATCGSNRLLQMLKRLCGQWGITGEVALEQNMACAIGMCFCCVRPFEVDGGLTYRRVCFEGPVFPLGETTSW